MATSIDSLMDSVYKDGKTAITQEKVNILRIYLHKAFPDLSGQAIADAASLFAVYCALIIDGKRISFNGQVLDSDALVKLFNDYTIKIAPEFESVKAIYDFYGSAMVVSMFVYQYTYGLTNKEAMFTKTRAGGSAARILDAIGE